MREKSPLFQAKVLGLSRNNLRHQVNQLGLLWLPAKQLASTEGMATGVGTPGIDSSGIEFDNLSIIQGVDLGGLDELLGKSLLGSCPLNVTPHERTVLSKVVTLVSPSGLATAGRRRRAQCQVDLAQILDMNLVPNIFALANEEALAALNNCSRQPVGLEALRVASAPALAIDTGWADNRGVNAGRITLTSRNDDFIHIAVKSVRGQVEELAHAFPVVILLGSPDAV